MNKQFSHLWAALLLAISATPLLAQVAWDGGGGGGNWSTGLNWSADVAPAGAAGAATFSGSTRTTNTNDITGLTFASLTFTNSNWSLSGNAFTLTGGITAAAGRTVTIANDIVMSNGTNVTLLTQNAAGSKLVISGNFSAAGRIISKDGGGATNNANTSDLIFDGNGKTVSIGEFRHRKGGVIFENGVNATIATNQLGNDATFVGIDPFQTIRGSSTVVSNTLVEIGRSNNAARLTLESGTFNAGTLLTGQNALALSTSGYYQSGGTANIVNMRLANNGSSTVEISGGTLNLTGATSATNSTAFKLVEGGTSVMTISGGEVLMGAGGGGIFQLATGTGNGTLNLNGGTLATIGFFKNTTNGTSVINLNGGTLRAGASTTGFLNTNANTTVSVGNGGVVIDTAGFNVTVRASLLAGGTGGLTKTGNGALTLEGNNTLSGLLDVQTGRVALAGSGSSAAAGGATGVTVRSGATLLLASSGQVNDTAQVTLSGGTILRASGVSEVFGNMSLTTASTLDFGNVASSGSITFGTYAPSSLLTVRNFFEGNVLVFGSDLRSTINNAGLFSFDNSFVSSWNAGTSTFTITAIPEPSAYVSALGLLILSLFFGRRGAESARAGE